LPASTSSSWTGLNSIQPEDDLSGFTVTRELRTRSATPNAPRLDTLFARDNAPPAQVLVVWDPGHHWPQFSLTHLALPPTQPLQRVLLRQEKASEVMAEFFVASSGAIGPAGWACVQVVTQPGDPLGLRIGLSLMEQAQRAVLLAGGPADKDLVRRIGEFVRSSQWEGPPLFVVAPADKPSRAERLRKATWPRGLRAHVLELFPNPAPDWTAELLRLVCGEASLSEDRRNASPSTPPAAPGASPQTPSTPPQVLASPRMPQLPNALDLACEAPGALACALWDHLGAKLLGGRGSPDLLEEVTRQAALFWSGRGDDLEPVEALCWSTRHRHVLCMPLAQNPDRLLLLAIDREFGDLSQARWQLAVARQHAG
jgi:hypothetical protein